MRPLRRDRFSKGWAASPPLPPRGVSGGLCPDNSSSEESDGAEARPDLSLRDSMAPGTFVLPHPSTRVGWTDPSPGGAGAVCLLVLLLHPLAAFIPLAAARPPFRFSLSD